MGANVFAALTEPDRDQLRVTVIGASGQPFFNGPLGTLVFTPYSSGDISSFVSFDLDQYQVAPTYITNYLTFGLGHPSEPAPLPSRP